MGGTLIHSSFGGLGGHTLIHSSLLVIDGGLFFINSINPILFSNEKEVPNCFSAISYVFFSFVDNDCRYKSTNSS